MDLSICIATYNRASELDITLASLKMLDVDGLAVELVVIDNNSRDETRKIAESHAADYPYPVRYVFEPVQGHSAARNAGIRVARGRIVAFLDDDVDVAPRWARTMLRAFSEVDAAAVGGRTWLVYPSARPEWIGPAEENLLSRVELGNERIKVSQQSICGCNMAFHRDWLQRVGGFRVDMGRVGTCLLSNDETDLMGRIVDAGGELYYDPAPMVGHRVPTTRLQRRWFLNRIYWQGRSAVRGKRPTRAQAAAIAVSASFQIVKRAGAVAFRSMWNGISSSEFQRRLEWLCYSSGEFAECLWPGHQDADKSSPGQVGASEPKASCNAV